MKTIDEYIATFPEEAQIILEQIRSTIKKAAPDAKECISWGMPTFKQYGNIIHFAKFKNHIGLYPGASGIEAFKEKLSCYKTSKGAVQFPLNKPIPLQLITQIVQFKVEEDLTIARDKDKSGFLFALPAPARRALENLQIATLKKLSQYDENELLQIPEIKESIPILKKALADKGMSFRNS